MGSVYNPQMSSQVSSPTFHTPSSPSSPAPRSRLRGLSYLLSRDHSGRPSLSRATSYPSSPASPNTSTQRFTNELSPSRSNITESLGSPTAGQDASSRVGSSGLQGTESAQETSTPTTSTPMTRARSATVGSAVATPTEANNTQEGSTPAGDAKGMANQLPSIRFTAHHAPGASRPSLVFSPLSRILPTGREIIKVGRYSERDNPAPQPANVPSSAPVGFKSKVVSRRHCEFWYSNGRWYIKDVKSSSGTFLNHIRLSSPGTESPPFPINDGDIVQLGIDFKGGEEMIFRCVKIRVELNKGWQSGPNNFNMQSHKRLRELNNIGKAPAAGGSSQDCAICLGPIAPCQSLFVAPCSHTWHFKCIRQLINGPMYPHFVCPNCRTVADLEAELDDPFANGEWEDAPAEAVEEPLPNVEDSAAAPVTTEAQQDQDVAPASASNPPPPAQNARRSNSDVELGSDSDSHPSGDNRHTPSPDSDSSPAEPSSSTVAAVDIVSRKSISEAQAGLSLLQLTQTEGSSARTPSPNGISTLAEGMPEGPMTPRNDFGPFVFDGSAGRVRLITDVSTADVSADEAEDASSRLRTEPAANS